MHIYKVWQERIESGVFTKGQCQQFVKCIVPMAQGRMWHGKRTNLNPGMAEVLVEMLKQRGGVRLTSEHEQQGVDWLRRHGAKALNTPTVQDWVDNFDHFLFMGDVQFYGTTMNPQTLPVWRIVLTDGRMVDYYNAAWQTATWSGNGFDHDASWQWVEQTCRHCGRAIVFDKAQGLWIDPEAPTDTDDAIWREACDRHETFTAEHEPVPA